LIVAFDGGPVCGGWHEARTTELTNLVKPGTFPLWCVPHRDIAEQLGGCMWTLPTLWPISFECSRTEHRWCC